MLSASAALAACAAAVVLGLCSAAGTVATALGVSAVIVVAALGWPQLLGAPARTSLTIVLALTFVRPSDFDWRRLGAGS